MYMHITQQDGSSSTKKKDKDLTFKVSQEKGKARVEYESSSDDEIDEALCALHLLGRRTSLRRNPNPRRFPSGALVFRSSALRIAGSLGSKPSILISYLLLAS